MTDKCALILRVSTEDQSTSSQIPDCLQFIQARGFDLVTTYEVHDSAWKGGVGGPEYRKLLQQIMADAWAGKFRYAVCWRLDRIARTGAESMLRINRQLRERGCTLLSVTDSWLNTTPEIQDVLLAFAGWHAQRSSDETSARVINGLQSRAASGGHIGRKPGSKDKKKRKTDGYVAEQARRKALRDRPMTMDDAI